MSQDIDNWISRYELRQHLGQGGMGVAYLAEDKARNHALCVLKQMHAFLDVFGGKSG